MAIPRKIWLQRQLTSEPPTGQYLKSQRKLKVNLRQSHIWMGDRQRKLSTVDIATPVVWRTLFTMHKDKSVAPGGIKLQPLEWLALTSYKLHNLPYSRRG